MTRAVILPSRSRQPMAGRMEPDGWSLPVRLLASFAIGFVCWFLVLWPAISAGVWIAGRMQ